MWGDVVRSELNVEILETLEMETVLLWSFCSKRPELDVLPYRE